MENIDAIFKEIIFDDTNPKEQQNLLKLYKNYKNIKETKDYERIEKENYAKQNIYNDKEKIQFEFQRLYQNILKKTDESYVYLTRLNTLEKVYYIYSNHETEKSESSRKDKYQELINSIIYLELDVDMKIGLYKELCELFEKEVKDKYEESNIVRRK